MNKYEEKLAARKQRLLDSAERANEASNQRYEIAKNMADGIPFGQPILLGHHSEKRDRNYRARITSNMNKSVELQRKANYYEQRAASVGKGGISSDDPEAIAKLERRIDGLKSAHERMKKVNAIIRKHKNDEAAALEAILALELLTEAQAKEILAPGIVSGKPGFASYALTNNNANIRRLEKRLAELKKAAEREEVTKEYDGFIYKECPEENRVMFIFDGKPSADIRDILKGNAFKWSPSRGAWVRHLNNAGLHAAKSVKSSLNLI